MRMISNIAFIGATGMLGKPVARELIKTGFKVTALVRDATKAKKELPAQIELICGDIRNSASIENLLKGQEALYINLSVKPQEKKKDFHPEGEGLKMIIEAAKKSSVKRIAYISSLAMNYQGMNNFRWWVFDLKHQAVTMIKDSDIPYTIFYPSTFIENLNGNYRQGNRMLLAGKSNHKMYFISAEDYSRQVARSFQMLTNENKEYVVQGPEGFTADEAVEEYVKFYTRSKLTVSRAPLALIKFLGKFSQKMNYGAHILEALNNYPEKFEAHNTWQELGKPMITIQAFAQRRN